MSGIERAPTTTPIRLAKAVDDLPEMERALADRALTIDPLPSQSALFIVGHGPDSAEDYAAWMTNLRRVADSVQPWTGYRDVRVNTGRLTAVR